MALTRAELQKLVEGEGLRYFLDPTRDALMVGCRGLHGRYQFVMLLEVGGTFLQMRTISYHQCPADHPHARQVLEALGRINYEVRLVKFGYDPSDGEIVAYADLWIMDNTVTQAQLSRMLGNYLPTLDLCYPRLVQTMETGKDPGAQDPASAATALAGGSLPEPLRALLASIDEATRRAGLDGDEGGKDDKKKGGPGKITKL
jgi:hypothetical protein